MEGTRYYNKEGVAFAILSVGRDADKEKPNMVFIMPPGSNLDFLRRIFH